MNTLLDTSGPTIHGSKPNGALTRSVSSGLPSADVYTDINSLQSINNLENKDEALQKVAKQFESIFVSQMLKSMRQANAVFEEDSLFNSQETNFYRDMHDQQLALTLSHGRGLGIADALYRQLSGNQTFNQAGPTSSHIAGNDFDAMARRVSAEVAKAQTSLADYQTESPLTNGESARAAAVQKNKVAQSVLNFTSPENFVESVLPLVEKAADKLGVNPLVLVAQSALETGWGKFVIKDSTGEESNNLFNIKANSAWQGESVSAQTLEHRNGQFKKENAQFRQYESLRDSVGDYADFILNNPRYQSIVEGVKTAEQYIRGISQAGYATDPDYADKVLSVLDRIKEMVNSTQHTATELKPQPKGSIGEEGFNRAQLAQRTGRE